MKQKIKKTIELVCFLHHIIKKKNLLKPNQSMVLAVSGGQDSITLFFVFLQLKEQWDWKYNILYCNHLWQKDSFYTLLHLFKLSYLLNTPICFTFTLQKVFTEQFARNWRSLTFQRITEFYFFNTIVTGHSKSDRVETGLFNLFRGSSTKGVSSLNWTKTVLKEGENFFKINKKTLKHFYIKNCASIVDVDLSCLMTYCNTIRYNQKWRQSSNWLLSFFLRKENPQHNKKKQPCKGYFARKGYKSYDVSLFFTGDTRGTTDTRDTRDTRDTSLYPFFVSTAKCSTHVPSTSKRYVLRTSKRDVLKRYVPLKEAYPVPLKDTTPYPFTPRPLYPSTPLLLYPSTPLLLYPYTPLPRNPLTPIPLYPEGVPGTGYWVLGTGYWILGAGYKVPGTGYWGTWVRIFLGYVSFFIIDKGAGYVYFRNRSWFFFFGVLQSGIVSLFLRKKGYDTICSNSQYTFLRKDMRTKKKRAGLQRNIKKRLKKKEQLPNQKTILVPETREPCFAGKCLFLTTNRRFYLVKPILKYKTSCFNIFNRKKTNGSKQYCLQFKQLIQHYLQLVLWEKKTETTHNRDQNANHVLDLLLTRRAVKCFTILLLQPFKKSKDLVIKRFYIYKVDCIKCRVGTKKHFEKKTSFLKKTRNCLCFFKGNAVFFCFSPLQKPLRQLLR